jgi:hypothetical protein
MEGFIKGLNDYLIAKRKELGIDIRGRFVFHTKELQKKIKVYKQYEYKLWYLQKGLKAEILSSQYVSRTANSTEERKAIIGAEAAFSVKILEFLNSQLFDKIIKGEL